MDFEQQAQVLSLLDVRVTVLDQSARPALRVEGSVFHEPLLDALIPSGDLSVAGTPPAAPPRRAAGRGDRG